MSRLATPWALVALPLAVLAVWWIVRTQRTGGPRTAFPDARGLAGLPVSPWARIERVVPWLRGGAIALAVLALSRPQTGASLTTVSSFGVDIVIALDISGSMRCEDTRPRSRLTVAKECIGRFVEGRPADRIGLVAFGSLAATRCPLTLDHELLARQVDELGFAPAGEDRTALGMGLATAVNRMRGSKAKSRVVVLVTDGRSNAGSISPETAGEAARALGVKVYTVGVGSEGEVPCLVDDPEVGRRYVSIRADFDEPGLRALAAATGARYFRASDADGMARAFEEIDALERSEIESRVRVLYTEKFLWALAPAGGLLALELLLAGTRLRRIP